MPAQGQIKSSYDASRKEPARPNNENVTNELRVLGAAARKAASGAELCGGGAEPAPNGGAPADALRPPSFDYARDVPMTTLTRLEV